MSQLWHRKDELAALDVRVAIITFRPQPVAMNYLTETGIDWPLLIDEARTLYAAYGMERGSDWQIWGPASWGSYIQLLLKGRRLRMPSGDVNQLGGDVLVDPTGIVRLYHASRIPVDRPSVDSILDCVRSGRPSVPSSDAGA